MLTLRVLPALGLCGLLTGCGGAGRTPTVLVVPTYAESDPGVLDAAGVITSGGNLTAGGRSVAAIAVNYENHSAKTADAAILVQRAPEGDLSVEIEGQTQAFTQDDRRTDARGLLTQGYVVSDDAIGKYVGFYGHSGEITELLSPKSDYAEAVSLFTSEIGPRAESRFLFAIIGTQTRADRFPATSLAGFYGYFRLEAVPTQYQSFAAQRSRFEGQATLSVAGDGTVSGVLSRIRMQPPGADFETIPGAIALQPGVIDEAGFDGTLTVTAPLAEALAIDPAQTIGRYGGTFYGPNGEEVAGTLSVDADSTTGSFVGAGFFLAD